MDVPLWLIVGSILLINRPVISRGTLLWRMGLRSKSERLGIGDARLSW
jgi:hypothetical protein